MTKQTDLERRKAHMNDTVELLREVIEGNNIPREIYGAALVEFMMQQIWKDENIKSVADFIGQTQAYMCCWDEHGPNFVRQKLMDYTASITDPRQRVQTLVKMLVGADNVKLENGKIKI